MPNAAQDFEILLTAANEEAGQAYREGIASEIVKRRDDRAWRRFRLATARAYVLSKLLGVAGAFDTARKAGATITPADEKFAVIPITLIPDDDGGDFVTGLFLEAIEAFEGRVPILADIAKDLIREGMFVAGQIADAEMEGALVDLARRSNAIRLALRDSFWVSGVDKTTTINLREIIAGIVRGDADAVEIRGVSGFIDEAQSRGAANLTRSRLGTIYRNNLSSAFNDGTAVGLAGPEVKSVFPLVRLREIQDDRSRKTHRPMNGYINTIEVFAERGLVAPNGHRCRGGLRGVTWTAARRLGLLTKSEDGEEYVDDGKLRAYNGIRQDMIDSGVYPDPGFAVRSSIAGVLAET